MEEHETNTGWWTEKPDRQDRPSSFAQLGAAPSRSARTERVWLKAVLMIALMAALGWAILRLAVA
jgi:hypothetical protein